MTGKDIEVEKMAQKASGLAIYLMQKEFTLTDVGLTDKVAFDWTRAGLYLEERKSKYRRKYNAIEYVWLRMVKELREFGLSFDAVRNLKGYVLSKLNMMEMLVDLMDGKLDDNEDLKALSKTLKKTFKSKKALKAGIDEADSTLADTILFMLIYQTVVHKLNIHLLIAKDGRTFVVDGEPFDEHINVSDILNGPYISYPIRHVLTEFLAREDLMNFELINDVVEINKDEQKVLDLLRQDNLVSLNIKLADKEIKLIETEEEINVRDVRGKLVDYIKRNSYQEIIYKTEKGKIVSMKRKTKHK